MKKYKVGYTTGVFDMFHIGHLNILKQAKEQCEHLIVGVSTDEVVLDYKHHLPVIPFEQRKQIVEAIKKGRIEVSKTGADRKKERESYYSINI
jgi:glycerol-3-phosphate cytidylyltransferase